MKNRIVRPRLYDNTFEPEKHFIEVTDGRRSNKLAITRGNATFTIVDSKGLPRSITLKNALLAPEFPSLSENLFSVRAATDNGANILFTQKSAQLIAGQMTFELERSLKLCFLPSDDSVASTTKTLEEWHKTLGHLNYNDIINLGSATNGMKIAKTNSKNPCLTCKENKMTRLPKSLGEKPILATKPLDCALSDICGPIQPASREGYKYIINFVDEYSSMLFVHFLRSKDEAPSALKNFIADVAPIGRVKDFYSDNALEYLSQAFTQVLLNNGIK